MMLEQNKMKHTNKQANKKKDGTKKTKMLNVQWEEKTSVQNTKTKISQYKHKKDHIISFNGHLSSYLA